MKDLIYSRLDPHLLPIGTLLSDKLGLPHLAANSTTFLLSFLLFSILHPLSSYVISPSLFPKTYKSLDKRTRYHWDTHVVSMVHACITGPWAVYYCLVSMPNMEHDKAFGWDGRIGALTAFASAYFLWDIIETIYSRAEIGFVIHGVACFLIYMVGHRPFVAYYGARALTWELSTPFLNIHWFLDKMQMTGSTIQLINGFTLLTTFFGARLIYGSLISYWFVGTLLGVHQQVPWFVIAVFLGGNIVLNYLNWMWFFKMISALKKRFPAPSKVDQDEATSDTVISKDAKEAKPIIGIKGSMPNPSKLD